MAASVQYRQPPGRTVRITTLVARGSLKRQAAGEPSHGRGEPEVPEPLILRSAISHPIKYLAKTRSCRPTGTRIRYSPETNIGGKMFILTGSSSLEELNWSETFVPQSATPTVG